MTSLKAGTFKEEGTTFLNYFAAAIAGLLVMFRSIYSRFFRMWRSGEAHESSKVFRKDPPAKCFSREAKQDEEAFPAPVLFTKTTSPEFPFSLLQSWIGNMVTAVSGVTQTPPGLAILLALTIVATAVQRKFVVSPTDGYAEPLDIFVLNILPQSNGTTAAYKLLMEPMVDWQRTQSARLKPLVNKNTVERKVSAKRQNFLISKAARAETQRDREGLLNEILEEVAKVPTELVPLQVWTDDVSLKTIKRLLANNGNRLSIISDGSGVFRKMLTLCGSDPALNTFLQGSPVFIDRSNYEVELQTPAISGWVTEQPKVINNIAKGRGNALNGHDLLNRFLLYCPESLMGTRDVSNIATIHDQVRKAYFEGIQSLLNLEAASGENGDGPRVLTLTPDALRDWTTFREEIEERLAPGCDLASITGWAGKLAGVALRISGLLHISEQGTCVSAINSETVNRAITLCRFMIYHAKAIFGLLEHDSAEKDAMLVCEWLLSSQKRSFRKNEIFASLRTFRSNQRLDKAIDVLIERHIVLDSVKLKTGGRPAKIYQVNAKALDANRVQKA